MRILLLAGAYDPNRWSGAAVAAEQTAAGLRALGHTVIVVTAMPGAPGDLQRWQAAGVPVLGVAVTTPGSAHRHPPDLVRSALTRIMDAVRPDVVHVHSWRLLGDGAVAAVADADLATVVTITASDPDPPRELMAGADWVVAPDALQVLRVQTVPPDQLRTIGHGVAAPDPQWRRPPASGPLRFGYVGGTDARRGHEILVRALTSLGRTDYELHAVDRATLRGVRALRDWDFRVPGLVRLVPGYSAAGRDAFYGGIDVLLHLPQDGGSTALAVREAQSRGVWPITSAGQAGFLRHRIDGEAVPAGSADALASAITWALDHPQAVRALPAPAAPPSIEEEARLLAELYAARSR